MAVLKYSLWNILCFKRESWGPSWQVLAGWGEPARICIVLGEPWPCMWKGRVGVVLLTCVSGAELGLASEVSFFQGQTQASADLASWPWYTPHGSHSPAIRPVCGWSAVPLLRLLGQSHPATGNAARSQAAPLSLSSSVGCHSRNIFESHVAPWADAAGRWHCTTFSSATVNFKSGERKRCWWERNHPLLGAREPFFLGEMVNYFLKMKKSFVVVCIQAVPALEEDTERLRSLYTHLSVFAHGGGRREDFPCSCPAVHGLTILQALASVLSSYWSLAVFPALGCLQPLNPSGIIVWTAQQLITTNTSLWHLPHYVIIKFKQSNFSGAHGFLSFL